MHASAVNTPGCPCEWRLDCTSRDTSRDTIITVHAQHTAQQQNHSALYVREEGSSQEIAGSSPLQCCNAMHKREPNKAAPGSTSSHLARMHIHTWPARPGSSRARQKCNNPATPEFREENVIHSSGAAWRLGRGCRCCQCPTPWVHLLVMDDVTGY